MTGLLDTGSQVTLMQQQVMEQHFSQVEQGTAPLVLKLKAANGLDIPYSGYAIMDSEIQGVHIPEKGYIWPVERQAIKVPPRSETIVWGRDGGRTRKPNYIALVEATPVAEAWGVARTLSVVQGGRVPVRLCNPHTYPVTIGRNQKLGRLYQVEETDVQGPRDLSLTMCPDGIVEVGVVDVHHLDSEEPTEGVGQASSGQNLTSQQQDRLQALLHKWKKAFADDEEDFGQTDLVQHRIHTGDAPPIKERYRPLPPSMYQEIKLLLTDMLEKGVVRESCSPWAAPIVLVKKKDGSWRFCVDYRKLNSVTHKDAFPLPRIEETLTNLTRAEWFSTLDLASGYWQVTMDPRDREKTAFTTPMGLFEFERMPFGLCNAPATFQRLMQQCLSGHLAECLLVYLDDVIIYSADFSSHLQHLDEVFQRLVQHGLKLRRDNSSFHSDQGANFESSLVQQLCQLYGVSKSRTTSYHPAGNGAVERMNQTLLNMLRSLEAERQRRWPEYLPELLAAYNNTVHSSTGYAPSFLMFGRHLRQPVDLSLGVSRKLPSCELQGWVKDHQQKLSFAYKLARRNWGRAADRSKQNYDRHANAFPLVLVT
nr:uncharacterized protein LOC129157094 [Nothobranchius furzeri]